MSSAWTGIAVGGLLGGVLGYVVSKKLAGHADLGVTVAAAGALALVGGALMAPKPQDQTSETASAQSQAPATTP